MGLKTGGGLKMELKYNRLKKLKETNEKHEKMKLDLQAKLKVNKDRIANREKRMAEIEKSEIRIEGEIDCIFKREPKHPNNPEYMKGYSEADISREQNEVEGQIINDPYVKGYTDCAEGSLPQNTNNKKYMKGYNDCKGAQK